MNPASNLSLEHAALSRLVEKLSQEQALLAEATAEGLTDIITEKAAIVAEMSTLAGNRHALLGSLGYSADES
ncbi:flagellar export chaperone FlgN, partial [Acinetobacter baumannii]